MLFHRIYSNNSAVFLIVSNSESERNWPFHASPDPRQPHLRNDLKYQCPFGYEYCAAEGQDCYVPMAAGRIAIVAYGAYFSFNEYSSTFSTRYPVPKAMDPGETGACSGYDPCWNPIYRDEDSGNPYRKKGGGQNNGFFFSWAYHRFTCPKVTSGPDWMTGSECIYDNAHLRLRCDDVNEGGNLYEPGSWTADDRRVCCCMLPFL